MARKKTDDPADTLLVEIRYDGPGDRLDATSDGTTIRRGDTGRVSVETAQHLLGCDYADITVVSGDVPAAWPESNRKIDALADRLGVTWPEPKNGSAPLTAADKASYLEAAGYSPDGTKGEDTSSNDDPKEKK